MIEIKMQREGNTRDEKKRREDNAKEKRVL
jgi:hypothetical protein